jgi:hypothetical protein
MSTVLVRRRSAILYTCISCAVFVLEASVAYCRHPVMLILGVIVQLRQEHEEFFFHEFYIEGIAGNCCRLLDASLLVPTVRERLVQINTEWY